MMQLPERKLVIQIQHNQQLVAGPGFPNGTHGKRIGGKGFGEKSKV